MDVDLENIGVSIDVVSDPEEIGRVFERNYLNLCSVTRSESRVGLRDIGWTLVRQLNARGTTRLLVATVQNNVVAMIVFGVLNEGLTPLVIGVNSVQELNNIAGVKSIDDNPQEQANFANNRVASLFSICANLLNVSTHRGRLDVNSMCRIKGLLMARAIRMLPDYVSLLLVQHVRNSEELSVILGGNGCVVEFRDRLKLSYYVDAQGNRVGPDNLTVYAGYEKPFVAGPENAQEIQDMNWPAPVPAAAPQVQAPPVEQGDIFDEDEIETDDEGNDDVDQGSLPPVVENANDVFEEQQPVEIQPQPQPQVPPPVAAGAGAGGWNGVDRVARRRIPTCFPNGHDRGLNHIADGVVPRPGETCCGHKPATGNLQGNARRRLLAARVGACLRTGVGVGLNIGRSQGRQYAQAEAAAVNLPQDQDQAPMEG